MGIKENLIDNFHRTEAAHFLLDNQKQLDSDGTNVGVSRQAIDEVLTELATLRGTLGLLRISMQTLVDEKNKEPMVSSSMYAWDAIELFLKIKNGE